MGVPGPIKDDGTVLKCVNLGWGVFNVAQSLSVLCGGIKVKAGDVYKRQGQENPKGSDRLWF